MRHAKAVQIAVSDHERELTDRGIADAGAVGRWAVAEGLLPDHAVVSSATRTRQTWSAFARAAGLTWEPEVDRSLYSAGTDSALELIRTFPHQTQNVLLVGHNPTVEVLVHLLDDGGADPTVFAEVSAGYPTAALTVLEVPGTWDEVDVGSARIIRFHVGRGDG